MTEQKVDEGEGSSEQWEIEYNVIEEGEKNNNKKE